MTQQFWLGLLIGLFAGVNIGLVVFAMVFGKVRKGRRCTDEEYLSQYEKEK